MFLTKELIDKTTYTKEGEESRKRIDQRLMTLIDQIKEAYNYTMVINTWFMKNWVNFGDMREFCGFRPKTSTVGKLDGAHYRGMAADILFYDKAGNFISSDTIRAKILADAHLFPWIRCMEVGIGWVHIDVMDENDSPIKRAGCDEAHIMLVNLKNEFTWFERKAAV